MYLVACGFSSCLAAVFFFFAATVVGKICSVCGGFGAVFVKTIMRIRVAACFRRDRRGIVSDTNKLIRISIGWRLC